MPLFGRYGRFANQLWQHSFMRIYAEQHDLEMQIPPWVGNYLFGIQDPPVTVQLPPHQEVRDDSKDSPVAPPKGEEFIDHEFQGYAQLHTSWYAPHKEKIREWYRPVASVKTRMDPAIEKLRAAGKTPIGVHLRRGDYGILYFYTTPVVWCVDWLRKNWDRFDDPVLFLATEDASLASEFAKYKPLLVEDLGIELSAEPYLHFFYLDEDAKNPTPRGMDFYPEFYTLTQCDVLLISNSSFSFFAAMLNQRLKECWRPHLPTQSFIQIDPWNTDVLRHDNIEDYPEVKGLRGNR